MSDSHIENIPVYSDAIITPTSNQRFSIYGAVYGKENNEYKIIKHSQRWCGDKFTPQDPKILNGSTINGIYAIQEPSLYLGHLTTHYGHFLMETLLRFWAIDKLRENKKPFKYIVFNPWFLKRYGCNFNKFLPFMTLLKVFGLTMRNVIVVNEKTKFSSLYVPVPMGKLAHPNFNDHQNVVFDKIYISRKHAHLRSITNESTVEELFRKNGFQIVYMEKIPFVNQIATISHAKTIAGFTGSGLHNTIFTKNAIVLMLLGDRNGNNFQIACDKLRDNKLILVKSKMQGRILDIRHLTNYMNENSNLFN